MYKYGYIKKIFLMNRNEKVFYKKLTTAVGELYTIFPQVHFDELIEPGTRKTSSSYILLFRHMNQKSVDFVICDRDNMMPLLAIELDGTSHQKQSSMDSDNEKKRVLEEIKLPLLHFDNSEITIDTEILAKKILETIHHSRIENNYLVI